MKEAAGEANMTVITIVLIAIVLAVGTIIVSRMMSSSGLSSACSSAGGTWNGGKCWRYCTTDTSTGKISSCSTELNCTKATDGSYSCKLN